LGFVVGISRQLDGSEQPVTPVCKNFVVSCKVVLTCLFMNKMKRFPRLKPNNCYMMKSVSMRTKLWAVQDQLAAQLILQTWLNQTIPWFGVGMAKKKITGG
jgi:putative Holliday junction resolvase